LVSKLIKHLSLEKFSKKSCGIIDTSAFTGIKLPTYSQNLSQVVPLVEGLGRDRKITCWRSLGLQVGVSHKGPV
jgi:hypothetical protein